MAEPIRATRVTKAAAFAARKLRALGIEVSDELVGHGAMAVIMHAFRRGERRQTSSNPGGEKLAAAIARIRAVDHRTETTEDVGKYPEVWRQCLNAMDQDELDRILALDPEERKSILSAASPIPKSFKERLTQEVAWIEPYLEEGGRLAEEEERQKQARLAEQMHSMRIVFGVGMVIALIILLLHSCN